MKTRNMPPGLRRYWESRGRGRKSTALTVSRPRTVTRYVKGPTRVIRLGAPRIVSRRRRGGGGGGRGGGGLIPPKHRLQAHAIAALYGYSESGKGFAQFKEFVDKLPTTGKAPKEGVAALLLNYFARKSPWLDAAAAALGDIAGYKLGQQGFQLQGDDYDDE